MNENESKPNIDRFLKNPSLTEIVNMTQEIINLLPEDTKDKATNNSSPSEKNQLNVATLNSLVTNVQSIVNPTTLSLLNKTLKLSEAKEEDSEITSLTIEVEQLSAELKEVKEGLNQVKTQLAEQSQRFDELETTVKNFKRRRRR